MSSSLKVCGSLLSAANIATRFTRVCQPLQVTATQKCFYAKAATSKKLAAGKVGKVGAAAQKVRLEVETDPHKLCNFLCGGNIYKEGQDPQLLPESEYPEWLWTLRTERGSVPLEELDKESWQYWNRLLKEDKARFRRLDQLKYKYQRF